MSFKGWEKVKVKTDGGDTVTGIAPVIISASRATDIPAYYSEWFIDRLKKGYIRWVNPYNGVSQFVSFVNTRCIVFWTKNPKPMIPYLSEIDKMGIRYFFHVTLNDYEKERFEINVPPLTERIKNFLELSSVLGKNRVLWRFDPLITTRTITTDMLLERVISIGEKIGPYTNRLTFSFLIHYEKVKRNSARLGIPINQFTKEEKIYVAEKLGKLKDVLGIKVMTCAEEEDYSDFGVEKGKCVDLDLLIQEFSNDVRLMKFIGYEPSLFSDELYKKLKDPGQRSTCNCIASKDIGGYDTCPHLCVYCYANATPSKVKLRYAAFHSGEDHL